MLAEKSKDIQELMFPESWKILVVDDEVDVHTLTKLECKSFTFRDKPISILSAYTAMEAEKLLSEHDDIAILLLDVVMESNDAGLRLVDYIRNVLNNRTIRIVIRTGQPGYAPEQEVITNYDINDYREKAELTTPKFITAITSALRSYLDLLIIQKQQMHLENVVRSLQQIAPQEFLNHINKGDITKTKSGISTEKVMNIMYCDIGSYTDFASRMDSAQSIILLNGWFHLLAPTIRKYGGFIDKYEGDGVLVLFEGDIENCINCGIALIKSTKFYADVMNDAGFPFKMGIGINTGKIVMGTIGDESHMECALISHDVKVTYYLQRLTEEKNDDIIISKTSYDLIKQKEKYKVRRLGMIQLRNKNETHAIYSIMNAQNEDSQNKKIQTLERFERGIEHYRKAEFEAAIADFEQVLAIDPDDSIAKLYLEKSDHFHKTGLPRDWNGALYIR